MKHEDQSYTVTMLTRREETPFHAEEIRADLDASLGHTGIDLDLIRTRCEGSVVIIEAVVRPDEDEESTCSMVRRALRNISV